MPDWDELSGGGEMDELAMAATGVAGPPTVSPFPPTMYVPTVPPTAPAGVFPKADVQATGEATGSVNRHFGLNALGALLRHRSCLRLVALHHCFL